MLKIKVDADGHAIIQDGKIVYVDGDGKDVVIDVNALNGSIVALRSEAANHRREKETAQEALKKFEGIEDPDKAREAMATVANLTDKKLVDAGDVQKIKDAAIQAVHEQYKPTLAENEQLKADIYKEKVGGAFARSKYIADNVGMPLDFVEARFSGNFKVEDGKIVAYYPDGNKVFSTANAGEAATFEEAIEKLISVHPQKGDILKGSGHTGAGSRPGDIPNNDNNPWKQGPHYSLTRQDEIEAKDPATAGRMKAAAGVA
jgi:hypothetical protein